MSSKFIELILKVVVSFLFITLNVNAQSDYFRKTCRIVTEEYFQTAWAVASLIKDHHSETNNLKKQESVKFLTNAIETITDKQFRMRQRLEKDAVGNPDFSLYVTMLKWGFEYGLDLAMTQYGNSEAFYERAIHDECIRLGNKADAKQNERDLRRIEISGLINAIEARQSKINSQVRTQTIINNVNQPRFCTSIPDGAGSSRLLTTCF